MHIVSSSVRRLAKSHGRKVSKSFIEFLNRRVETIILDSIKCMESRKILSGKDAEVLDKFRMTRV